MQTVTQIAQEIVAREGGYVNDPDDPGGATNYGVTIHTMRRLGLDLTKDGQVDSDDVRVLTREHAVTNIVEHFYRGQRNERLPAQMPEIVYAYGIARRNYYYDLAYRRPASRKYARRRDGGKGGWIKRAEEFISARYHLTEAQHKARVAQWV